ncbi:hypothetical protein MUK70_06460 [Dyadobacter chenwenxiniae]|uniref:hypothetical protein n=1 Tax=Dyadobacter chenwenxiniae TaxID=2906456 RepID=UPI001FD20921|nr:hypothetical protein [Dyadobacter chenwenxiniae]UON84629.1 hypothetical protein MUK70_06460 [Dyadobacter chenwenxiniae]
MTLPTKLYRYRFVCMVAARQSGEISKETFSEWINDDRTFEEEQEAISLDGPPLSEVA